MNITLSLIKEIITEFWCFLRLHNWYEKFKQFGLSNWRLTRRCRRCNKYQLFNDVLNKWETYRDGE